MAINLSTLSAGVNKISQLSGAILVTPKIKGFNAQNKKANRLEDALVFAIEAENTITLTSDITDHVVEDNTVRNDQIAIKPEIYKVRGFIGELEVRQEESLTLIRETRDRLILLQEYAPELTTNAIRAYNAAEQALRQANNLAANFKSAFGRTDIQNNQQKFYQQLKDYWKNKTLFTIQTPWELLDNMAIQTLKVMQDETTQVISDFEITFKKITFAKTVFETREQFNERLQAQAATRTINGNISANESSIPFSELLA